MIPLNSRLLLPLIAFLYGAPASAAETNDVDLIAVTPHAAVLAPQPKSEISGARIGWHIGDIRAAFRLAAEDGKPIVIVADGDDGGLFANVLRCPTFNTLAGQAHFVLASLPIENENSDVARIVNALHMDTAFKSTIAILETKDRHINEVARLTGYHEERQILARFAEAGLSASSPNPLPLAKVALGGQPPRDCAR